MYFSTKNILKSNHNYSLIEKFKKKIEKRKEKKRKKGIIIFILQINIIQE